MAHAREREVGVFATANLSARMQTFTLRQDIKVRHELSANFFCRSPKRAGSEAFETRPATPATPTSPEAKNALARKSASIFSTHTTPTVMSNSSMPLQMPRVMVLYSSVYCCVPVKVNGAYYRCSVHYFTRGSA